MPLGGGARLKLELSKLKDLSPCKVKNSSLFFLLSLVSTAHQSKMFKAALAHATKEHGTYTEEEKKKKNHMFCLFYRSWISDASVSD